VEKLRQKAIREGESPEKKEFMCELARKNIGKKSTPEHCEKIRQALSGKRHTDERRLNNSRAQIARNAAKKAQS